MNGLALGVIVRQWFRQAEREGPREDWRLLAGSAADTARAKALLGEELREGWSVPWWRLAGLEARQATVSAGLRDASPVIERADEEGSGG